MTEKMPSFEEDLARLEALAEQMEQGEMPLEKLLDAYEKGALLAKSLDERLKAAAARLYEVGQQKDGTPAVAESGVTQQESLPDGTEE
jgi:exodeoxyribonuclease VII small subunit